MRIAMRREQQTNGLEWHITQPATSSQAVFEMVIFNAYVPCGRMHARACVCVCDEKKFNTLAINKYEVKSLVANEQI